MITDDLQAAAFYERPNIKTHSDNDQLQIGSKRMYHPRHTHATSYNMCVNVKFVLPKNTTTNCKQARGKSILPTYYISTHKEHPFWCC